jgi:hypothetical protein
MIFMLPSRVRLQPQFPGKLERDHDQWIAAIGANNQKIGDVRPGVQLAEPIVMTFDFDATISAEQWHAEIATEAPVCSAGQRHAVGDESSVLQRMNKCALEAISLVA